MQKNRNITRRASSALVPFAVAGLLAGLNSGCTAKTETTPSAGSGSSAKGVTEAVKGAVSDAVAAAKHACKGLNACKGQGACKSGDAG
ncbi:MAG: hypothetical protein HZA53_03825 [Planctomycetes bacterium]|nr:hypothetical protein [Planctomycetota bacterium]